MRARYPDHEGYVDRDGVDIFYEVYDNAGPTVVLVPTTIWNSRQWKAQIHYLARHFRVVAFEGRGNGRSGKPTAEAEYANAKLVGDVVAVMDRTGADQAILMSLCHAVPWMLDIAARQPERASALVAVAPAVEHVAHLNRAILDFVDRVVA